MFSGFQDLKVINNSELTKPYLIEHQALCRKLHMCYHLILSIIPIGLVTNIFIALLWMRD